MRSNAFPRKGKGEAKMEGKVKAKERAKRAAVRARRERAPVSKAIQSPGLRLDCFLATAPRNDEHQPQSCGFR
jgi:hypothetical protein